MPPNPHTPNIHSLTVAPGTFCISCRYDLMGLPAEANCPQCSRAIRDSLRFSPGSSGLPLAFDAWCTACGYNLVGLPDNSKCPECGKSIAESLQGDLLLHANPDHVRTLRLGASLIFWGSLLTALMWIVQLVVTINLGRAASASALSLPAVLIFFGLADFAVALITLFGWWKLCSLDPAYNAARNASQSRLWIRILLCIALACKLITVLGGLPGATSFGIIGIVSILAGAVWLTRFFFEMSYIRWLAPRLSSDSLAKSAARLTWLAPVLLVIAVPLIYMTFFVGFLALLIAAGILFSILIMYWSLLYNMHKHLLAVEIAQRASRVDLYVRDPQAPSNPNTV